ncbi:MAG: hypothetical protein QOJ13_3393 [Gaiellales bacterium]|jgi:hypothetical protein|nr:hypothetical protein [Gaiellales bacterium]
MGKDKPLPRRLEGFRQETGMDVEAFVAAWKEGTIPHTPENAARFAEAERLWEEVKARAPAA